MPAAAVNHTLEAGPVAVPRAVLLPVVHDEPPPGAPGASPAACARVPQPARTRAPVLTTTTMDARQRSMTPIQTPVKPAGKGPYTYPPIGAGSAVAASGAVPARSAYSSASVAPCGPIPAVPPSHAVAW